MSERTATRASRGLIGLAVVMILVTLGLGLQLRGREQTAPIVVGSLPLPSSCDESVVPLTPLERDVKAAWCQASEIVAGNDHNAYAAVSAVTIVGALLALLWIVTGSLIVSNQPRNLGGWLFMGIGLAWTTESFGLVVTTWALVTGVGLPARGLFAVMGDSPIALVLLVPMLFLLYPDGRAPQRWRWLPWVFVGAIVATVVGYSLAPGPLNNFVDAGIVYANPIGVRALDKVYSPLSTFGAIAMLIASLATVLAIRSRYARSTGDLRQQMRWLVAVATLAGVLLLLGMLITIMSGPLGLPEGTPVFPAILIAIVLSITVGVPAAYLVAIFRHGLWDLDVVIRKTAVAVVLALLFAVAGGALLLTIGTYAFDSDTPRGATVAIGVALGVLILPMLFVARRVAVRIVYGKRASRYEVLADFGRRIGETYETDDVLPRMARVLAEATGAIASRVLIAVGDDLLPAATFGSGTGSETSVPVTHQGERLGALEVTMPQSDPMNPARERLIDDLATQAGPVLRNVRLIEELRASRQRLVAAQDEERRKLERNIHDGVQQQLVALAVKLKLADSLVDRDVARAHEALTALQTDATSALEDLRDLARGIYPPLLADKGLAAALEAQARKAAVPTTVQADGIGRYDQGVESAVYFCSLEALNNIAKYAGATSATVGLAQTDGYLTFTVTDDGAGFDASATSYGTGLQGMADRLDAIGGELHVTSRPGQGTIVTGSVPVGVTR
jgi:signal transduction histidine kinase